ncbi:MAG: hypothetical protein QM630_05945 [Microbacterium sp.]
MQRSTRMIIGIAMVVVALIWIVVLPFMLYAEPAPIRGMPVAIGTFLAVMSAAFGARFITTARSDPPQKS